MQHATATTHTLRVLDMVAARKLWHQRAWGGYKLVAQPSTSALTVLLDDAQHTLHRNDMTLLLTLIDGEAATLRLHIASLDRIMIGFNGTSAAVATNKATNPLLQDVNVGWIQQYKTNAASRVLTGGATPGTVKVGATGDYKNLDALVMDTVNNLVDPWYQEDTALVCILSRDLLADKYFPLVNTTNQPPSEQMAADMIISQKRVGGLQAVRVPFVPANTMLITTLDNLSIYYQDGARRRTVVDNAKRDRVENYESSNDAFVVEDYGRGCVITNIALV
jgi:P2 family phage major capsid protein